jgi:hypothetical protein
MRKREFALAASSVAAAALIAGGILAGSLAANATLDYSVATSPGPFAEESSDPNALLSELPPDGTEVTSSGGGAASSTCVIDSSTGETCGIVSVPGDRAN